MADQETKLEKPKIVRYDPNKVSEILKSFYEVNRTVKNVYENGNYDVEPILQTGPFSTVKSTSADPWICTLIISTNHNLSKRHKTNRIFSKKTSEKYQWRK